MNNVKKKLIWVFSLRWIARIWSILGVAFLLFMLIGHVFGESKGITPTLSELVELLFFIVGIPVGLIVALKWELIGGLIAVASLTAFHITYLVNRGQIELIPFVDGLAVPGFLFLICWFYSRNQIKTGQAN